MTTIKKDGKLKYTMSATDPFVGEIAPGEKVTIECEINCNGDTIIGLDSRLSHDNVRFPFVNPSTGPFRIKGAKAGQMLTVRILAMKLAPLGYTGMFPNTGIFPDWIWKRQPEFFDTQPMKVGDGVIHWKNGKKIPIKPMVGVIGVAPIAGAFLTLDNGEHGGNLDVQELGPGGTLHLPIQHDDAYFYVGDCHARQGDGEVSGMGATEIPAEVTLSVELADRPKRMTWPRFETETHIGTIACARPLEDAMRTAFQEMIYWLGDYGMSEPEAYKLLGTIAEARCTQMVNPKYTYVCKVDRSFL